jgi:serine/threonine protein kinase
VALRAEDTLVEAMRAAGSTVEDATLEGPVVELITRLKDLRAPLLTGSTNGSGAAEEDGLDFLAPPQGPGELGRLGGYRVLRVLGAGGMGIVLHAEDLQLGRPAALKVLRPALAAGASARQRFLREAKASAAMRHDNVVTIYQVGEDRGVPFLAMELLEGETLEDRLQREGRLPAAEVVRIGRQAAIGLAAAHAHGLIHRDVKPGNLFLEMGRVKLLDFGLARAAEGEMHLTQTGAILGTPAYMSPEQARGEAVDARSDLFSLGCVLYRACTGRLPFRGTNPSAILLALTTEQPRPPRADNPDVPPGLSALVLRLLAKDPARRPVSAREVADALGALELGPAKAQGPRRRGRRLFAAVAALALAAVVLAGSSA